MTKEEKIKEAWGEHYALVKNKLSPNGSLEYSECWELFGEMEFYENKKYKFLTNDFEGNYQPKSLEGIENNNGWTKIESETDNPKENGMYHVYYSDGTISSRFYHNKHNDWSNEPKATHYKPIEKPKPPIY